MVKEFLTVYRKYSYLGSKELEPILLRFKVFLDSTMNEDDFNDFKVEFKQQLETDYKTYLKELEELTS